MAKQPKKEDVFAEFISRIQRAGERVGGTPESRVRWVFSFVMQDVSRMSLEERIDAGDCLRSLHDYGRWHVDPIGDRMPDRLLKRIHGELREGVNVLFGESRGNEWRLPSPHGSGIHRMNPLSSKETRLQQYYQADERTGIIGSVVDLLVKCQGRIRACAWCHQPFVRNKRQTFCTKEHSQAKRNHSKKA